MGIHGTFLFLFLLLNQILLHPITADYATETKLNKRDHHGENSSLNFDNAHKAESYHIPNNTTDVSCLIDTQMGLITVATAGGLIVCLLVSTLILACQGCYLQHQLSTIPLSHSHGDSERGTGYWSTNQPEMEGLVRPCDIGVMLEEVKADREVAEREKAVIQEKGKKDEARLEEGAQSKAFDPKEMALQVHSSSSMDSCPDVPRDLEDMPLMV